jgi:hypothetical protein
VLVYERELRRAAYEVLTELELKDNTAKELLSWLMVSSRIESELCCVEVVLLIDDSAAAMVDELPLSDAELVV